MKRVYYHYAECEEYKSLMWRKIRSLEDREGYAESAAIILRDIPLFKKALRVILTEWPKSCETNLSSAGSNRQAWLGWAACFIATAAPEECTRMGWRKLTEQERSAANAAADEAIAEWETRQRTSANQRQLFEDNYA